MARTAFITGITGQDGSYLAELLLEKGYRVVGLARRSTNYHYPNIAHLAGRIELEYGDLLDAAALAAIIQRQRPDEVYHLAAQSVPGDSWSQPLVTGEITALGTVRMLEAVRQHKPDARFYQATSREIYGGVPVEVVDEDTPFHANNPYGIAKLYAHQMAVNYRESWDMFVCAGMLFNHESPRRGLHFVTRKVTMGAACIHLGIEEPPLNEAGQPLVQDGQLQIGNLDAWRDWGYAKEYVEAMWLMLQQDEARDYVIGTNTACSIRDLCRVAFAHVGLDWEQHVVSADQFLRPTEIFAQRGNPARAKADLGWEPRVGFEELIRMMVDADLELLMRQGRT
ncbi:MAG: GDP-mannose 4,6-dehydratase [Anaerolineaceae bacterium]|nr:GDP-mannose 4,6-dehydratase [Anaerolineaceae bacterium]